MFGLKEDHRHRCYVDGDKHKFEPRYDEVDSNRNARIQIKAEEPPEELRKILVLRKYIGDICVWCGKTIKRADVENPSDLKLVKLNQGV